MLTARPANGGPSLPEVHASVATSQPALWRRMFAFAGPAYLVSVGYMDPGNWATDLAGGARFGYQLLWVLVMSNFMAILLQTLSARLGIANGRDLAQACREAYPRPISYVLWILCEVAIAACDLAEVLGAAIGLNLLFGLPVLAGVFVTAADTLLVLWFTRFGIRVIEAFILSLITIIGACFLVEVWLAKPAVSEIVTGLVPRLSGKSLYIAIGILGATVMPHNLYLHSALVQTRRIGADDRQKQTACRFNLVDSVIALNGALLVNAAILILSASVFFQRRIVVDQIQQAYLLLAPLLGTSAASVVFAIALLCSGQSSTLTGTMAGQIVMEGFVNIRMRPWLRRLLTRMCAVVPAALTVWIAGEKGMYQLLILSQVILSMQLPFAIIPLIHFTSDRARMGRLVNPAWIKLLAWTTAGIIIALNIQLVMQITDEWLSTSTPHRWLVELIVIPVVLALLLLLLWITLDPVLPAWLRRLGLAPGTVPAPVAAEVAVPTYRKVLVPLDHSDRDRAALTHGAAIARQHQAKLYLLHVEEGVTSQVYGPLSSTAEIEAGQRYFQGIVDSLKNQGITVEMVVRYSNDPRAEIVSYARELGPDLIVMGAHGHKGLKDLVFGNTINAVRHDLDLPILIVRSQPDSRPGGPAERQV